MLPFFLYFIAAAITGLHVYTLLALAAYGVPFDPLELLSLLGSLCLLLAAYISLFKPHAAARLALLACLTIWSFYGPAIAKLVRTKFVQQSFVLPHPAVSSATRFNAAELWRPQFTPPSPVEPQ
jgi:hypothetical protein